MKPIVVYYLHYYDKALTKPAYNEFKDYATCVMAENNEDAFAKTRIIAGSDNIKIMGVATGREEWVNENKPLGGRDKIMPRGGWKQN